MRRRSHRREKSVSCQLARRDSPLSSSISAPRDPRDEQPAPGPAEPLRLPGVVRDNATSLVWHSRPSEELLRRGGDNSSRGIAISAGTPAPEVSVIATTPAYRSLRLARNLCDPFRNPLLPADVTASPFISRVYRPTMSTGVAPGTERAAKTI